MSEQDYPVVSQVSAGGATFDVPTWIDDAEFLNRLGLQNPDKYDPLRYLQSISHSLWEENDFFDEDDDWDDEDSDEDYNEDGPKYIDFYNAKFLIPYNLEVNLCYKETFGIGSPYKRTSVRTDLKPVDEGILVTVNVSRYQDASFILVGGHAVDESIPYDVQHEEYHLRYVLNHEFDSIKYLGEFTKIDFELNKEKYVAAYLDSMS